MPTLEDVLGPVRDARDNIECGRVNDADWLLEAVEDDLVRLAAEGSAFTLLRLSAFFTPDAARTPGNS